MRKLFRSPLLWLFISLVSAIGAILSLFCANGDFFSDPFGAICVLLALVFFCLFILLYYRLSPAADPAECALPLKLQESLAAVDWTMRDVLMGTVRTPQQLQYCMTQHRYHAPAKYFTDAPFPLNAVALYEEDVGTQPGICRFGRIQATELVTRDQIPVPMRPDADPKEIYYQFHIDKWHKLPRTIKLYGTHRGSPKFTNTFLLEHCTKSYQLIEVNNEAEFRLMYTLDQLHTALSQDETLQCTYSLHPRYTLAIRNGHLYVTDPSGWIREKISIDRFIDKPDIAYKALKKLICK